MLNTFKPLLKFIALAFTLLAVLSACTSPQITPRTNTSSKTTQTRTTNLFIPSPDTTWHAQFNGNVSFRNTVDLYIVDLFTIDPALIEAIQTTGRHVLCAFSGGSHKPNTSDAAFFSADMLGGAIANTSNEFWVDHRIPAVRRIMDRRFAIAQQIGCNGVAVSRLDGIHSAHGINGLANADQFEYNQFLAEQAHARGLSIGLIDSLAEAQRLAIYYDFSLTRDCHAKNRCGKLSEFVRLGKATLITESDRTYLETPTDKAHFCREALSRRFNVVFTPANLDGSYRDSCSQV